MDTFSALADPTRRHILVMLAKSGQLSATDIYDKFPISAPAISQHLKVLKEARLVRMEKQSQKRLYEINTLAFQELEAWAAKITKLWNERSNRLDKVVIAEKKSTKG